MAHRFVLMVSRRSTLLDHLLKIEGWRTYLKHYLGCSIDETLYLVKNNQAQLFYTQESIDHFVTYLKRHLVRDSQFGNCTYRQAITSCHDLITTAQTISRTASTQNKHELAKNWSRYRQAVIRWSPFLAIPNPYEKIVETELINTHFSGQVDPKLWSDLTSLPHNPALIQETIDLMEIALQFRRGSKIETLLTQHWHKYRWLKCYNPDEPPYPKQYFSQRARELAQEPTISLTRKLTQANNKLSNDEKLFQAALKQINLSSKAQAKLIFLRQLIYLKTFRMEAQMQANYHLRPFLSRVGQQLGLSLYQLNFYTPVEIATALTHSQLLDSHISQKRQLVAVTKQRSHLNLYFGQAAQPYLQPINQKSPTSRNLIIRGRPASPGQVKGIVRVITRRTMSQIKPGEILVTQMTTPDFLPAMIKAKAFITDIGGVTSHAAIVAREFHKPCIVGTGNATQILKTGNYVFLDANQGIITKL